jgi:hypothetical protein
MRRSRFAGLATQSPPHRASTAPLGSARFRMFLAAFTLPESRGPEADLKMWQEAELDFLCSRHEDQGTNEAVYMALVDIHNRCIE